MHGAAFEDLDFVGSGDVVEYRIDTADYSDPFRVSVELPYQAISFPWANNLPAGARLEIDPLLEYYEAVPNIPVVMSATEAALGEFPVFAGGRSGCRTRHLCRGRQRGHSRERPRLLDPRGFTLLLAGVFTPVSSG